MKNNQDYYAKGNSLVRLFTTPLLYFAWFAPHRAIRVFFHRLRGVKIGKNVEIGYFCLIGNIHPRMITIEDNAVISARVTILEHDNSYYYTNKGKVRFGDVIIGDKAFIGIGSVIMPGIKIGARSIVGSLSFVNKNVHDDEIVAGNPAKSIKK